MGTRILYSERNTGICSWPPSALCRRGQDSLATEDSPKSSLSFFRPEGGRKIKGGERSGAVGSCKFSLPPLLASVGFMPAGPRLFSYRRFTQKPFIFLPPRGRKKDKGGERSGAFGSCKFSLRRDEPDGRLQDLRRDEPDGRRIVGERLRTRGSSLRRRRLRTPLPWPSVPSKSSPLIFGYFPGSLGPHCLR